MEQTIIQRAVFFFFLVLFCISIVLVGRLLAPFFATILLGIVASGVFKPVFIRLSGKMNGKIASVVTCCLIFFIVFIPLVFFVGVLSREAFVLYGMVKDTMFSQQLVQLLEETKLLDRLNEVLAGMGMQKTISWGELVAPVSNLGQIAGGVLFDQVRLVTSNLVNLLLYFGLMLVVSFYMFVDGNRFTQYLFNLSPLDDAHDRQLFDKFHDMTAAVLLGNGLGGLIQGVAGGILFWILGLNSPILWGFIMGFLAFLPIVGIGIILVPTAILFLLKSQVATGVVVLVFYMVLSWSVEYVFKPKVVGDRMSMHPLVAFLAIVGGLKVFGLLGIIYGPLIATLFFTLADIYFSTFQVMVEPSKSVLDKISTAGERELTCRG